MKKLICWLKGHKRGDTWFIPWEKSWHIECARCGHSIEYISPHARLVGVEMNRGFTGE